MWGYITFFWYSETTRRDTGINVIICVTDKLHEIELLRYRVVLELMFAKQKKECSDTDLKRSCVTALNICM